MENYYTIKEVAEIIKVTTRSITNWIATGKLKSVKIAGIVRIKESDLIEFIKEK
jgi:excisionase family DNA binding protein